MDTSKEYIKMCEKAEEIQEKCDFSYDIYNFVWNREYEIRCKLCNELGIGDYCQYCGKKTNTIISEGYLTCDSEVDVKKPSIWLPRQDQLQAIIDKDWFRKEVSFYDFAFIVANKICVNCFNANRFAGGEQFYEECIDIIQKKWKSMEQLWLAFVMKEKYGKTWSGKDWVKQ